MNMTIGNISFSRSLRRPPFFPSLWRTGGVALLILGLTGNILTLVVVGQLREKAPSYLFILALAVSDIFMNFSEIPYIFEGYNGYKFESTSVFMCKIVKYFIQSCRMTSACLIAAVSVYRAVEVKRPLLNTSMRNPRFVTMIIVVIWVGVYASSSFYLYIADIVYEEGKRQCFYKPGFRVNNTREIFTIYGFYVHIFYFLGSFLLPFLTMIISDIILIRELYKSAKQVAAISSQQRSYTQITVLVLAASVSFFLFNGPLMFSVAIAFFYELFNTKDQDKVGSAWAITHFMSFINSSTDFFIYVLAGREVRRITKGLMLDFMTRTIEQCFNTTSSSSVTAVPTRNSRFTRTFLEYRSHRKNSRNLSTSTALELTTQVGKPSPRTDIC